MRPFRELLGAFLNNIVAGYGRWSEEFDQCDERNPMSNDVFYAFLTMPFM